MICLFIKVNFAKKGESVINSNINAIESSLSSLEKVDINLINSTLNMEEVKDTLFSKLEHVRGDLIKVSDFISNPDGIYEKGTSKLEKRDLSSITPSYDSDKCIMCNMCSLVCPHAVIRPYLLNKEEKENALDINPTQGLHDIESMLKPSMPGEKTFDLNNPIDNIETGYSISFSSTVSSSSYNSLSCSLASNCINSFTSSFFRSHLSQVDPIPKQVNSKTNSSIANPTFCK